MTDPATDEDLGALAEQLARGAGAVALEVRARVGARVTATKSTHTDIVTEGDHAAERLIRERLSALRPGDAVLGEEGGLEEGAAGGATGGSGGRVRWVVDPVDGTVNYLYGLPVWAVSVAAQRDGETVAGCVHVPPTGETFTAVRGRGARLDGAPIQVSGVERLDGALVATGFGYDARRRAHQAEVLRSVLPAVRDIRRAGAASVDLCWVACGRVDASYERGLKPWDLAAGALVAQEAGARVGGLRGAPAGEDLTIAAPPVLFDALAALLEPLGADRDA